MKIQLGTVLRSQQSLLALNSTQLPFAVSYKLSKNIDEFQRISEHFTTHHKAIFDELAGEDGKVPENLMSEYQSRIAALEAEEVDTSINQISVNDIPASTEISPADLFVLGWLFTDGQ